MAKARRPSFPEGMVTEYEASRRREGCTRPLKICSLSNCEKASAVENDDDTDQQRREGYCKLSYFSKRLVRQEADDLRDESQTSNECSFQNAGNFAATNRYKICCVSKVLNNDDLLAVQS